MTIPEILKTAKLKAGLTQDQTGELVGLTGGAYSKIETGVNDLDKEHVAPLCDALDILYLDLLRTVFPIFRPPCGYEYKDGREVLVRPTGIDGEPAPYQIILSPDEMSVLEFLAGYAGLLIDGPGLLDIMVRITGYRRRTYVFQEIACRNTGKEKSIHGSA